MVSSRPFWLDTVSEADFAVAGSALTGPLPDRARIVIVGGGIVGLACAYYLAVAGADGILVLERGELLHEASGANGGGLWPGELAPDAGAFHRLGTLSQEMIAALPDPSTFQYRQNGVLVVARKQEEAGALRECMLRRAAQGLPVEWLTGAEVLGLEPHLNPAEVHGAGYYRCDGHVNPARLGAFFAREAQQRGAVIRTGVTVRGLEELDHLTRVFTAQGSLVCSHLVVTAGAWSGEWQSFLGLRIPVTPARGQLVATAPLPPLLTRSVMGSYGLLQSAEGHMISGGTVEFVGFDSTPSSSTAREIWEDSVRLLPALHDVPLTHSWARLRPHSPDELPLLGACGADGRHIIASGHYRNGLLLCALTGHVVADLLTRGTTVYPIQALDPHRFSETQE